MKFYGYLGTLPWRSSRRATTTDPNDEFARDAAYDIHACSETRYVSQQNSELTIKFSCFLSETSGFHCG
jgi:hypothetical protein